MDTVRLDGIELACDVTGSGEPVLLIGTGPIADSFLPFLSEKCLVERYRLIRYHQRGQAGSTRGTMPVTFAEHAADAAALLGHLGVARAHVAGHSTGAAIAMQLAVDHPDLVHTLVLLEPPLLEVASARTFLEHVGPALAAYDAGDREEAMARFLTVVCSLGWEECRAVVERHAPGGAAQAIRDADTFFGSYLPALTDWHFGRDEAARISQPVLSVLGTATNRLFVDGHVLLHTWFPQIEDCRIDGVAHLLHIQQPMPVAQGVSAFLARHPIRSSGWRAVGQTTSSATLSRTGPLS